MSGHRFNKDTTGDQLVVEFTNEIRGKAILVTGISSGGLGAWFVAAVAKATPKLIILAARDVTKAALTARNVTEVNPSVKTRILRLDMASFRSVRQAAQELQSLDRPIDVLVNNIGIMATPYAKTEDGLERQWQTNYLGPFLFTGLIIPKMLEARSGSSARVVNVSSEGYRGGGVQYHDYDFHDGESYHPWTETRAFGTMCSQRLRPK